jgi:3-phenylpropionate/trans-cinnamate dioxygenase ferredoxin reductase component
MARRRVDQLLIGGGLAAGSCARWLREEGADGSILLVGREPDPPYNRPPLSKGYLRGEESKADALYRQPEFWAEQDVEILTRTSVMSLDPAERVVTLSSKDEVEFGHALLATGSNVRRLRVDGCDLHGIHYLRAFGNADAIRADAEGADRVVLIGGSYIGCEVAASLTAAYGAKCTIVMLEQEPLERSFGSELGRFFRGVLEQHGVTLHGGEELERFEGSGDRVERVVTKSGRELATDCVVIGAGVTPDTTLAARAGLALGERGGVRCSASLESSAPGIYAAGDICEWDSPLHGQALRVEHWDVAANHGHTAALGMLDRDPVHDTLPYFFSDLADWLSLEYLGPGSGDLVVRGSLDDGEFVAFWVDGARVTAALSIGRSEDLERSRRLIAERVHVDRAALADTGSDLDAL